MSDQKSKINEQFLLVIGTVIVTVIVIFFVSQFQNKAKDTQSENVKPQEKASAAILNGEKIKFGDKDFILYHIEPINYGLAMYYSGDDLNSEAKSKLIVNQYGNKISAKDLAAGIVDETGRNNGLIYYSNIIQSFTAPDSKGRDSYYIVMRDVELMASTSVRMHVIKVFEDNGATYSLIFQQDFRLSDDLDEELITKEWVVDNVTKLGQALDNVDITKSIDLYNQSAGLGKKLSVSNKFMNLKWNTKKIREESLLVDIDISYPEFVGGKEVTSLNNKIKGLVEETLANDRLEQKEWINEGMYLLDNQGKRIYDEYSWECRDTKEFSSDCIVYLHAKFEVLSVINDIVSVKLKFTDFTGGGNGNHDWFKVINYDLNTGQELDKQSLFCKNDYDDKLMQIAKVDIIRYYGADEEWVDSGTSKENIDYQGIGLREFGISIYFPPYTVTGGSAGIVEVFVPYSDLAGDICLKVPDENSNNVNDK